MRFYQELQADYYAGVWAHHAKRMNLKEWFYKGLRSGTITAGDTFSAKNL